ncbi:MAG: prephenate/arogenate dehydrogenase family protein [Janthinobacterium lividum]
MFNQITFVGIGLINGSIARDVRRLGLARRLVGTARRQDTLDLALALGLVDAATTSIADAVRGADLVVLGIPVGASGDAARAIAEGVSQSAIITDVGSVKGRVVELVAPHLDMRRFVPGHPVAGTEASGPQAAVERLFQGRWCILTPSGITDRDAVDHVAALWRALGSRVDLMDAEHHDKVLAVTSHLPHLLAFNIVNTADDLEGALKGEILKYAAGGFTDFTRIAASDPTMWRDVFLNNKAALLEVVGRYVEDLTALQRAIRWDEAGTLFDRFESARDVRREVVRAGQAYRRVPAPAQRVEDHPQESAPVSQSTLAGRAATQAHEA